MLNLQAKLYTRSGKHSVDVSIHEGGIFCGIEYRDPDKNGGYVSMLGPTPFSSARIDLLNDGWFLTDFLVTDTTHEPPLWQHKLTFAPWDGAKVLKTIKQLNEGA